MGVTAAAALMPLVMREASSRIASATHPGGEPPSSLPFPGASRQPGLNCASSSSRTMGSPRLTCTVPNLLRNTDKERIRPKTLSFFFGAPDSSPMYVRPSTMRS